MYINNGYPDSNVVKSFVLRENIENLRFMRVYYNKGAYYIRLDVTKVSPKSLRVFDVETWKDGVQKYGTIQGDKAKVNEIKNKLIHQFKKNK